MSLLEDVFLEDEAGEAQELERVIEGDDYDERPRYVSGGDSDNNSEKDDEAVEDKRRVDPSETKTKRVVKNPRFVLNPARLTGPRGIQVIQDHFKDFRFKGKGHEKEDLDLVLKKLEHWAYRLYPKFEFADCLKKIETLGKKRPVMVHLHKIRSDQFITEETVVQKDSSDEEAPAPEEDEFDKLLQQQIELARSTPAPDSMKKPLSTPRVENRSIIAPKVISSPSISDEQKERMLRNRRMAEQRRLARLRNANINANRSVITEESIVENDLEEQEPIVKKHNRSNVIDSSDEECEAVAVNQSITVDVHDVRRDVEMNDEIINDKISNDTVINDVPDIDNNSEKISEEIATESNTVAVRIDGNHDSNHTDSRHKYNLTGSLDIDMETIEDSSNYTTKCGSDKESNISNDISENDDGVQPEMRNLIEDQNNDGIESNSNEMTVEKSSVTINDSNESNTNEMTVDKGPVAVIEHSNVTNTNIMTVEKSLVTVVEDSNELNTNIMTVEKSPMAVVEKFNKNSDDTLSEASKIDELSNKENVNGNIEKDLMDVDFNDDF